MELPKISVVMPTLNSEKTLSLALESIQMQDYPSEKVEIIIADGGSRDRTLEIAKKYTDRVFHNPLKTGEAGKAVGVKQATGEIIALIDSDNILPEKDWFLRMVEPFSDTTIVGSEPLYYTYRKMDSPINRYCALIGMNDPFCIFTGNYDRFCMLTGKWTGLSVEETDAGNYKKIILHEKNIPTIGANGFLIRREYLNKCDFGDYLFDIDIIYELTSKGYATYAKVKTGIVHLFSPHFSVFLRKQRRRIRDFAYYNKQDMRKYPWKSMKPSGLLKFILYTITVVPLFFQVFIGYSKKKDSAWLVHIPVCWGTLFIYGAGTIFNIFGRNYIECQK
jgi:glycosyltransferase involved in cell wall biosynthesis